MAEPLALKDHSGESQVFFDRVVIGFALLILLTLLLVGRLFFLQVVEHETYATLSDENRIQTQSLPPIRGLIYDRKGSLIADNIPNYALSLTMERIDDLPGTLQKIDELIGLNADQVAAFERRLARGRRPFESVPLRLKLSQEEIARISVNRFNLPGVEIEANLVRYYPQGELMVHAVGSVRRINEDDLSRIDPIAYSGTDHMGKIGVEKFYEKELLGQVGHRRIETDARGRVMKVLDATPPVPGSNMVLHLDSALQRAASDALGERRGAIVAMEPSTGGILAMVSKPAYDPNLFVTGIDYTTYASLRDSRDVPLFNRAVQGQYEPGSTLKPFIGLVGLVTGVTNPEYTIDDPGWFKLPNNSRLYRDWNWTIDGHGGHGRVDLEKAIYRSCNVYFYELATKLGIDRIHEHLSMFGLGMRTALDLPEARSGLLPSEAWKRRVRGEPWYPGDSVNIGIGQGDILVTPVQLATAVSMLANRGKAISPRMVKSGSSHMEASDARRLEDIELVPDHVWDLIIGGMEKVVHRGNQGFNENGTAWAYIGMDIPYRMAGKSGTAQVVSIAQDEEYNEEELDERQRKHAWFVGFAPLEAPQIAVVAIVENGGGGSEVAAPVVREVLDTYLLDGGPLRVAANSEAGQ